MYIVMMSVSLLLSHTEKKLTFEKTDLDHFPVRVFLDFPRKIGFRLSGTSFCGSQGIGSWA